MSWDILADENGSVEIIITRWYNQGNRLERRTTLAGFQPFEPVSVELCGEDDESKRRMPREEIVRRRQLGLPIIGE